MNIERPTSNVEMEKMKNRRIYEDLHYEYQKGWKEIEIVNK